MLTFNQQVLLSALIFRLPAVGYSYQAIVTDNFTNKLLEDSYLNSPICSH